MMDFPIARLDFEEATEEYPRHIAVYFKDSELCEFWITYHPELTDEGITIETINASAVFAWSDDSGYVPDDETMGAYSKCIIIGRNFIDFLRGGGPREG